ncbi:hypothetical protein CC78DRAFT_613361 [Lojkania enalia]|uniref:Uncharacterized protein n=1 Tax=Lojkania enalia TaxID=147567 RepID=A0A9P4KG66_9PLEO|nr:hypothetical protein CC78DRAFT_613361 [Didymosphaeria enalia]
MDAVESAASRVLCLPELLEPILFYAGLSTQNPSSTTDGRSEINWESKDHVLLAAVRDMAELRKKAYGMRFVLCNANQVNRRWNAVIQSSPDIQEVLFMKWHDRKDNVSRFNPLLALKFTWGYFHSHSFPQRDKRYQDAVVRANASWRCMYPVLPPIRQVVASELEENEYNRHSYRSGYISTRMLKRMDGLRMDLLFDIAEAWMWNRHYKSVKFEIEWQGTVDWDDPEVTESLINLRGQAHPISVKRFANDPVKILLGTADGKCHREAPARTIDQVRIILTQSSKHPNGLPGSHVYKHLQSGSERWGLENIVWGSRQTWN